MEERYGGCERAKPAHNPHIYLIFPSKTVKPNYSIEFSNRFLPISIYMNFHQTWPAVGYQVLTTKLHNPLIRTGLVRRHRLIQRLENGHRLGKCITLVSAPAGFGNWMPWRDSSALGHLDLNRI
jgi:hypothetical protein